MFGKNQRDRNAIETLIGAKTRFVGDIEFSGGLRVDGNVKGHVRANAEEPSFLVVSETATIEGSVTASHVVVNGTVHGPIYAELLELQPKARVVGDVHYHSIEMHGGAVVDGALKHEETKPDLKLLAAATT